MFNNFYNLLTMYKCVIIDSDPDTIERLTNYIEKTPNLKLWATYTDPVQAMKELISGDKVDLIILDADMPDISGIELARAVRLKTDKLILATAHTKYAYQAFEIEAQGYLLKPFTLLKFIRTIQKTFPDHLQQNRVVRVCDPDEDFFFVKSKDDNLKIIKVRYDEVVAAESKLNYVQLHTTKKSILTYMSLADIANWFSVERGFIQFQRSFIISKNKIDSIDGNTVTMYGGQKVTVGDYYKKDFNAFVKKYLMRAKRKP